MKHRSISGRNARVSASAFTRTASRDFQPIVVNMWAVLQSHLAATISTGGAAKLVSVPPIETLTNSAPTVAYMNRVDVLRAKNWSRSISAASVIAAGSGNQRSEQRHHRQAQEVGCRGSRQRKGLGRDRDGVRSGLHDRSAGGDHHDDEHEHRFDELARVEVIGRGGPAVGDDHETEQQHRPQTEHGLHFAEQVPEPRVGRLRVGQVLEVAGRERVQHREAEQECGDDLHRRNGQSCDHDRPPGQATAPTLRRRALPRQTQARVRDFFTCQSHSAEHTIDGS